MTYSIRISDDNSSETIEVEDTDDVWAMFENYCKTSERGETIQLLKDGKAVGEPFIND